VVRICRNTRDARKYPANFIQAVFVLLCCIKPISGNRYVPGVSSREPRTHDWESPTYLLTLSFLRPWQLGGGRILTRHLNGRAASGGSLAPEPPRATRSQPEFILTVILGETTFFFEVFGSSLLNTILDWYNSDRAGSTRIFWKNRVEPAQPFFFSSKWFPKLQPNDKWTRLAPFTHTQNILFHHKSAWAWTIGLAQPEKMWNLFFSTVRVDSDWLRVAHGGCGAKAPPLAGRSVAGYTGPLLLFLTDPTTPLTTRGFCPDGSGVCSSPKFVRPHLWGY